MDAVGPSPDLRISLEPRAIARRLAIPAAFAAIAAAALVIAGGPLQTFADALGRALAADPRWVVAAVGFELASFAGYVVLLWLVAGRVSPRMDLRESAQITLGGAAATAPAAHRGRRRRRADAVGAAPLGPGARRDAARTLLTFLVMLYAVFLGSIALSGGVLTPTGVGPLARSDAIAAVPGACRARRSSRASLGRGARGMPDRRRPGRLGAPLRAPCSSAARVRDGHRARPLGRPAPARRVRLVGLRRRPCCAAMLNAFGAAPPIAVVVLAYFVGQVANTVPIPGAVSGGMVGVLLAFGVARRPGDRLGARLPRAWRSGSRHRIGLLALGRAAPHAGALVARGRAARSRPSRPVPAAPGTRPACVAAPRASRRGGMTRQGRRRSLARDRRRRRRRASRSRLPASSSCRTSRPR